MLWLQTEIYLTADKNNIRICMAKNKGEHSIHNNVQNWKDIHISPPGESADFSL